MSHLDPLLLINESSKSTPSNSLNTEFVLSSMEYLLVVIKEEFVEQHDLFDDRCNSTPFCTKV